MSAVMLARDDRARGSATIWVLALASLIWFLGIAGTLGASVRATRHQAAAAADMAALAAADQAARGPAFACRRARQVAQESGGRVGSCVIEGATADVTVAVPLPSLLGSLVETKTVMMRARAGPVLPGPAHIAADDATPAGASR